MKSLSKIILVLTITVVFSAVMAGSSFAASKKDHPVKESHKGLAKGHHHSHTTFEHGKRAQAFYQRKNVRTWNTDRWVPKDFSKKGSHKDHWKARHKDHNKTALEKRPQFQHIQNKKFDHPLRRDRGKSDQATLKHLDKALAKLDSRWSNHSGLTMLDPYGHSKDDRMDVYGNRGRVIPAPDPTPDPGTTDGSGSTDTGSTDTGSTDTGSTSTGSTDTGSTSTGSTDTGSTSTGSGSTTDPIPEMPF